MDETRDRGNGYRTHSGINENSHQFSCNSCPLSTKAFIKTRFLFLQAIFLLHANRVGHGYHVVQSAELYNYVIDKQIHLEVCEIQP